ncbi:MULTISPECIES: YdcF family protein [unclassified Pseudomonas]|uniref:YdcF family protein n=1 Tax=unclassified Pseudomonas TaxID=196821 RepID=UPI002AC949E8|nr:MULTISPECIES: YdcF family protein [unclassified Pseudomonas]MEB0044139.1 YdcF family protein [Pseudomonas sp. Dout3]MEB0094924.1 YdcF family protein [Pseudomonas sp. DC1.2]WPX59717.1 YdcF family protein [Pseudomonas sp. DC1.2]
MTPTLQHATVLWEFLGSGRMHRSCELIVVCGSYDLRVCDYACELLKQGVAPHLLFTGNTGNWTRHLWQRTEADVFAQRALALGVSADQFTLESRATNFAENIAYARTLFPDVQRATFLTKPNAIRRVALTLPIQWPGLDACVDSPSFEFPGQVSNLIGVLGLIDEMVGDVHRIMVYPSLGFQVEQAIPDEVLGAWRYLIEQGFDHHLIKGKS